MGSENKRFGYGSHTITAEQIKNVDHVPLCKVILWHGMKLTIRPFIDPNEVSQIIDGVISACFDDERRLFFPELLDFATRASIISHYANVALPDDISEQYRVVYTTDLYDVVIGEIIPGQVNAIKSAIELCFESVYQTKLRH